MNKTYLIEFSGENCPGCIQLESEAIKASRHFPDLAFVNFGDEETVRKYHQKFNFAKLPALMLLKDDEVLGILYGSQPEEILIEWIKAKLEK